MVRALGQDALRELAAIGALVVVAGVAIGSLGGFGPGYVIKVFALYACGAALVWRGLPLAHPHPRFGPANRLTLLRLAASTLLAAVIGEPLAQPDVIAWGIVVAATVTAVLDAADGPLARRSGLASEFGARFDMETDAWLTLVLCGLILHFDKAGAWVLAAGLMRYAFVGAARLWPWLSGTLPPSLRRKAVCVAQITTLIVCLGPIVPRALSSALAAVSVGLLAWSFAVDVRTLARARAHLLESST
ncbi:MAG TPA: CDP-alcohol phosphatidyltransferase family protein [Rhizobacter sp.]|jgi:phosphatidylglycerophosphate synthase|nr:CDP-alcohol phosphatidyltransferase family protein [Rhizobacter sp.]